MYMHQAIEQEVWRLPDAKIFGQKCCFVGLRKAALCLIINPGASCFLATPHRPGIVRMQKREMSIQPIQL